ncbi:LysE family translocator [Parapedomonas caeni]|jgi:threonine/homoserine/homoserine lactone efflux protein
MDYTQLSSLALYCFVCTATPGPNNIMLASSGLTFGFRRTVPHLLGINVGCAAMLALCGLGAAGLFEASPWLRWAVRIAGALYLGWLALALWRRGGVDTHTSARPLGFWRAAGFQFANPKAWAICVPAIATFTTPNQPLPLQMAPIIAMFVIVGLPSIATWAAMGAGAREILDSPTVMRAFIRAMAILTALTALLFLI